MRFRLLPIALAVACLLALAPTASAAVSWVVHGRGFGHGVGMSAYGAYGFAEHGKGYRFIFIGPEGTWCTLVAIDGYDPVAYFTDAAAKLGMHARLARGPVEARQILVEYGVLP